MNLFVSVVFSGKFVIFSIKFICIRCLLQWMYLCEVPFLIGLLYFLLRLFILDVFSNRYIIYSNRFLFFLISLFMSVLSFKIGLFFFLVGLFIVRLLR